MKINFKTIKTAILASRKNPHSTGHFIAQRLSAVTIIILFFSIIVAFSSLAGAKDMESIESTFSNPIIFLAMLIFTPIAFYHGVLGIQVIIDDYISCDVMKKRLMLMTKVAAYFFSALLLISFLKIAL